MSENIQEDIMKVTSLVIAALVLIAGGAPGLAADNLASKIKVAVDSAQKPGMEPGMYECMGGHLHVTGTLQNANDVPVKMVKLEGKVFDESGAVLGAATDVNKKELKPGATTAFDIEFVKVTGDKIQKVKKSEIKAVDAQPTK